MLFFLVCTDKIHVPSSKRLWNEVLHTFNWNVDLYIFTFILTLICRLNKQGDWGPEHIVLQKYNLHYQCFSTCTFKESDDKVFAYLCREKHETKFERTETAAMKGRIDMNCDKSADHPLLPDERKAFGRFNEYVLVLCISVLRYNIFCWGSIFKPTKNLKTVTALRVSTNTPNKRESYLLVNFALFNSRHEKILFWA